MIGACRGKLSGNDLFLEYRESVCAGEFQNLARVTKIADHDLGIDAVHVKESNRALDGFDSLRVFSSIRTHLLQLRHHHEG